MANLSSYLPDGIDESNVAITGGSINGTTIGASTAAAGTFTALTSNGIDDNADATAITIDSSENVSVGTTTAGVAGLSISSDKNLGWTQSSGQSLANMFRQQSSGALVIGQGYQRSATSNGFASSYSSSLSRTAAWFGDSIRFYTDTASTVTAGTDITPTERMRIDSSGRLLVGKTAADNSTVGCRLNASGDVSFVADGARALVVVRKTSDGQLALFLKDSTYAGQINARSAQLSIGNLETGLEFNDSNDAIIPFNLTGNNTRDNALDLGMSSVRFDDIYATNGTIQTSDRNEKQDIETLSEAEQRVAVAAKALLRKFRWKSAVRTKSHDARTHFGIIAQELQAAFEAEGLDAGEYGMFTCSEWWETYTDVPAVQAVEAQDAVYDEEGNLVSEAVEAVEAVEAHTRTDTYNTEAEAPEDAVRKERMGVRYSELLAFIIAAI